jgi:hypothetical protein
VARLLTAGDVVLNLNYDISFDLALTQAGRQFRYAPDDTGQDAIHFVKPHGSFNFFVNPETGDVLVEAPDRIPGSCGIRDQDRGDLLAQHGILPPRLNKSYQQHPLARAILATGRPFTAKTITFWGVGLTSSDADLLDYYRDAAHDGTMIEFINPSVDAFLNASRVLDRTLVHFAGLDEWLIANAIP